MCFRHGGVDGHELRVVGLACRDGPRRADLGLHVRDEDVGEDAVAVFVGEDRVRVVLLGGGGLIHVDRVDGGADAGWHFSGYGVVRRGNVLGSPDVGYIVELGDHAVPMLGTAEAVGLVHLRAEMAEDDNSGVIWTT